MKTISALCVYPIKSLGGIDLSHSHVGPLGLQYDRRWMLVDAEGTFLSQRTFEQMALFRPSMGEDHVLVTGPRGDSIRIPFEGAGSDVDVEIWKTPVRARSVSAEADAWFTRELGRPARLVVMPDDVVRPTHPDYSEPGDRVAFPDAFPVLVASQASLDDLNARLESPVPMNRFRPNVVVAGADPFEEDLWPHFHLGPVRFRRAKKCGRCRVTTINQSTAEVGTEPLRTLATYRREGNLVYFGTYFIPESTAEIHVGQELSWESQ